MTDTFRTSCFACGHLFDVTLSQLGQIVQCPECSQSFLATQSTRTNQLSNPTSLEEFAQDDESAFNLKAVDASKRFHFRIAIVVGTVAVVVLISFAIGLISYAISR